MYTFHSKFSTPILHPEVSHYHYKFSSFSMRFYKFYEFYGMCFREESLSLSLSLSFNEILKNINSNKMIFGKLNILKLLRGLFSGELESRRRDRIRKILADEKKQRNQKEFVLVRFINKTISLSMLQIGPDNVKTMPLDLLSNWNYQQAINLSVGGKTVSALQTYFKNLENIIGSEFDDILIGNGKDNRIEALKENDFLIGNAGGDIFEGGEGIDILSFRPDPNGVRVNLETGHALDGWGGNDIIIPTKENDNISTIENPIGSKFDDELIGNDNSYIIFGDIGNDIFKGGGSDDKIYGDKIDYFIYGDKGDEDIWGDVGNDSIYGKEGNDYLDGVAGKHMLDGGDDNDILLGFAGNDILDALYYSAYSEITHSEFKTKILRHYKACEAYSNSVYMRKYVNWCRYTVSVNIRPINSSIGTNIAIFKKCEKPHKQESRKFKEIGSNKKGKSYFYRERTKTMAA